MPHDKILTMCRVKMKLKIGIYVIKNVDMQLSNEQNI